MEYVASLSGGKDSSAMVLRLIEENKPLTKCVFYDTGAEFNAIYNVIDRFKPVLSDYGCELVILKPDRPFFLDMFAKPVCKGKPNEHYGYEWCGGITRWGTTHKQQKINKYLKSLNDEYIQYIGIAFDEQQRIKEENNKTYPLVEWEMTESDCLEYCRSKDFDWLEGNVDLYDVLSRVSCWCCANKNLKELEAMYKHLPDYWDLLKGLQSRIDRPFRRDGKTIFDLEDKFKDKEKK